MPNSKPALLIMQPHLGMLAPFLEPDFTVWRFWEGPPIEATQTIRALVVAGEFAVDKHLAESLPKLGLIACFTAGYDGIDVTWARARGLQVSHSPRGEQPRTWLTTRWAWCWAPGGASWRATGHVRAGAWKAGEKMIAPSLAGRRLGIVGLGGIGEAVARRAEAFGLRRMVGSAGEAGGAVAAGQQPAGSGDRERHPGGRLPRHRGEPQPDLRRDHRGAGARGAVGQCVTRAVVDEDAVIAALKAGTLGMAALDVFQSEPTPADRWAWRSQCGADAAHGRGHGGAAAEDGRADAENLRRFFAGEPVANPVECSADRMHLDIRI